MRYFRYKNEDRNLKNALREQYLSLSKDEKLTVRKEKFWRRLSTVVTLVLLFFLIGVGVYLLFLIPKPSAIGWQIVYYIAMVPLGLVVITVSVVLTQFVTLPLWKKADKFNAPAMKKEVLSKSCAHLREYYQLTEPYILTKCYNSTDERFTNHDVCIFVVGDELRITTDLVNGFLHGERDLGCYAFTKEEIRLTKKCEGNLLIAELATKDVTFALGYRAKSFVYRRLLGDTKQSKD